MSQGHAIVVGGGVIGAACAYYLNKDGWHVTIVDQGKFGKGCSHGNCGYVSPSHVLPLAQPGAIRMALKSLIRPDSPFYVKPRLDPALLSWFWKFARRCNRRDMLDAGHAIHALLDSSRKLYDELFRDEPIECEWEPRGLVFVCQSAKAMEHFAHEDELLRTTYGMGAERYDDDALTALEPALKPGIAGGWLYRCDAHLRSNVLMASWRKALEVKGVTIREDCAVSDFIKETNQARGVKTAQGDLLGDAVVVATGAWTPLLNKHLGCSIPIQPGKGYSITMPRPARCPKLPLIFEEHRVAITPMQSGYRIGSTMEFAGYDPTINRVRLEALKRGASHYLYDPYCDPVEEEWFGWRPMTPDGKPYIDRSPALSNVIVAAGHNMLGLSMATGSGKLVAELLSGSRPHIDPLPYSLKR